MKERTVLLSVFLGLVVASAIAIPLFKAERYSLYRDLRDAEQAISSIRNAEETCNRRIGRYTDQASTECSELVVAVRKADESGFASQIEASGARHAISLRPRSPNRLISLYCDQSGIIRLGTRSQPATLESAPVSDSRGK